MIPTRMSVRRHHPSGQKRRPAFGEISLLDIAVASVCEATPLASRADMFASSLCSILQGVDGAHAPQSRASPERPPCLVVERQDTSRNLSPTCHAHDSCGLSCSRNRIGQNDIASVQLALEGGLVAGPFPN